MQQKVVLFDIDYTLFDAKAYRDLFIKKLYEYIGYENKEKFFQIAENAYIRSKAVVGYFDPHDFLIELEHTLKKSFDKEMMERMIVSEEVLQTSLYQDVVEIVGKLHQEKNLILGIFSAGRISVQKPKINQIQQFLHKEHIHIFEFKKGKALPELLASYKDQKVYMIDDVLEILYNAKQLHKNLVTVWIRRGLYKDTQKEIDGFKPDFIISDLLEVPAIVKL